MLGLEIYARTHNRFPAHASFDDTGKPLLSWRVHLLPMLEENELYKQFHLDEPWNSEHNKQLVSKMPEVYFDPSSELRVQDGKTHYLGAKGEGYAFDGTEEGRGFSAFRDATDGSIMVLQVNDQRAAVWTKPADWKWDSEKPLRGLANSLHPRLFLSGFVDGSVHNIPNDIEPEVLHRMLTIAGGEMRYPK